MIKEYIQRKDIYIQFELLQFCLSKINKLALKINSGTVFLYLSLFFILGLLASSICEAYTFRLYYRNIFVPSASANIFILLLYTFTPILCIISIYLLRNKNFRYIKEECIEFVSITRYMCESNRKIMNLFRLKRRYKYFVRPKLDKNKIDEYILSISLLSLSKMYFDNIIFNKYISNNNNTVLYNMMVNLHNQKEYNEFYSKIFFSNEKKKDKTYHQSMLISLINSILKVLYTKQWFGSYYNKEEFKEILNFAIDEWYKSIIEYNYYK